MYKKIKLICIVLFTVICVFTAACNKDEMVIIEGFEFGGEYYISPNAPSSAQPFRDITAAELVSEIKIGWNLGNTFDAINIDWLGPNAYIESMETAWHGYYTFDFNIDSIKEAGFNAIRIPVSWLKASDAEGNIREDWMDRVTEVVNFAVNNDMYIIINSHHDEQDFKFNEAQKETSMRRFHKMWSQIVYNFRNYNEKLIFEALNEPRTKGSAAEWSGGTAPERAVLNEYYQLFVNIVRFSGGNNDKRILMVNTYAASAEQSAIDDLKIPTDNVPNKIIASIHAYTPYNFALNQGSGAVDTWSRDNDDDTQAVRAPIDRAYERFVRNGIPVIMGEFGAVNRNNEAARAEWGEYYVSYAREKGIPCFLWDNASPSSGEAFGHYDRAFDEILFPVYHEALMRGAGIP